MNIVIVGGGTAGWLAGYYIQQALGDAVTITAVESSKIGIIGVGEGATHVLGSFIRSEDISTNFDVKEFIIETQAAWKHGFKHIGWTNSKDYFFNPLDMNVSKDPMIDKFLARQIMLGQPIHKISDVGMLIDEQKVILKEDEINYAPIKGVSYHFDGTKVGKFFKKRTQATIIDSVVDRVVLNDQGFIDHLILENGQQVQGDLFIDCSGFSRVLMKAVGSKWVSYDNLLVNSALPFSIMIEPPVEISPWSTSTTLSSGWVWNIPIPKRFGCGYVFCEDFISFDQAQQEVEEHLGHSINPIKQIRFKSGRSDNTYIKNCVSLGLASAFVEPLEATSIHATTYQIQNLIKVLKGQLKIDQYNENVGDLYDEIKEFITLHYMGGKDTSPFWRAVKDHTCTDFVKNIIEISKHRFLTEEDIPNRHNTISYKAWNQVLAGLGYIGKDVAIKELGSFDVDTEYSKWETTILDTLKDCKNILDVLYYGKFKDVGRFDDNERMD
jgi:tryptophan halogenase